MNYRYIYLLLFILPALSPGRATAQRGINSLYSSFGIGNIESRDYSRNFGTGGAGIARPSLFYLNELNPASYSAIPQKHFILDAAIAGQSVNYKSSTVNQNGLDFNFKRIAIGFKANKRWGISAGLTPFSEVDYKLANTRYIEGTTKPVVNNQEGSGGINRVFISNGVQLTKNLSVGLSTAFLFGPVNASETLGDDTIHTNYNRYAFNTNFTAGLQYTGKVKDWEIGLGLTYRFRTNLTMQQHTTITNNDQTVLFDKKLPDQVFRLPEQYGAGLSLTNGNITWLFDYRRQQWGSVSNVETDFRYTNADRFAGGLEYSFKRTYRNGIVEGAVLQAGFAYDRTNLMVKGNQIKDVSGTVGVSLPNRGGNLRYYLGLEVGQRGTTSNGLIRENYINAVFHFSLRDIWFMRRVYD